jgi:translation initiation factor SUI1
VHVRIQQRNGRKCVTTIQGLEDDLDLKRICKAMKRSFNCNGNVAEDDEMGDVIQLQGDQRDNSKEWLLAQEIILPADADRIVIRERACTRARRACVRARASAHLVRASDKGLRKQARPACWPTTHQARRPPRTRHCISPRRRFLSWQASRSLQILTQKEGGVASACFGGSKQNHVHTFLS